MAPTVLIIDDCVDIARIIARYLATAAYRTMTATSGVEALKMLEQTIPDCIILDIMMPGMSGTELLHTIRHNAATAEIPVVLVSARVGYFGAHFRSEVDADFCVGKPFTKQQIVHAVRAVLAQRDSAAPPSVPTAPTPRDALSRIAEKLAREASLNR